MIFLSLERERLCLIGSPNADPFRILVDHRASVAVHHESMEESNGRRHHVIEGNHRQHAVPVHHGQSIPHIHINRQLLLQTGVPTPHTPLPFSQIEKPNMLHEEAEHASERVKQRRIRLSVHRHAVLRHAHEIRDSQRAERHRDRENILATRVLHGQTRVRELDVPVHQ